MALTILPVNSPLTQLRAQGFDAEFMTAHLIVYPKPKITNTIRQFVVDNLESIVDELNLEGYYRKNPDPLGYEAKNGGNSLRSQGILIWGLNSTMRTHIGAKPLDQVTESIPDSLNGNLSI
ncbi:hypothetical protein NP590_15565 [Methylomonas sp. SURF-2]|uniref:Uncharacterized protein n=1 Tax=Methylomonas subterranea TaxID=2952225 RepID=A0ABT1TLA6_9GAMM|nr:hypothetical protein [Methylomonas sp. SURF-2]MCQ8105529.1 hypothetical protein [Methylomonas sp. SURF-2]